MIMRPSVKLGKDLKKLTLGPNLGPLKYFFFVVFFDINIKNKAYSIKFYKHIVSSYKNIAAYLFSVWKKNHRPNISQLHPTASEKKTLNFVVNSVKKYPGNFEYCQCACK